MCVDFGGFRSLAPPAVEKVEFFFGFGDWARGSFLDLIADSEILIADSEVPTHR